MISIDERGATFGGVALRALYEGREAPFFVYSISVVASRVRALREAFGDEVALLYAVKANPHHGLLGALGPLVDGLDISSGGELHGALEAGCAPEALSFTGPSKSVEAVDRAVGLGVGAICVESHEELALVAARARVHGGRARVRLRINPPLPIHAYAMGIGGKPSPFGIDIEALDEAIAVLRENIDALEMVGTHHFVGSQCLSARALTRHVEQSLAMARRVEEALEAPMRSINFGGGFGVPRPGAKALDIAALATQVNARLETWARGRGTKPKAIFELGRYIVGPAGLYLCRVVRIKASRGETFVLVDGGIHHLFLASGAYSAGAETMEAVNLSNPRGRPGKAHIVGKLCTPLDRLASASDLAEPRVGDWLALGPAGAYGATASPQQFLSHAAADEIVI